MQETNTSTPLRRTPEQRSKGLSTTKSESSFSSESEGGSTGSSLSSESEAGSKGSGGGAGSFFLRAAGRRGALTFLFAGVFSHGMIPGSGDIPDKQPVCP